ncbi:hypothetical protein SO802_009558 [Lithocarpus litseifolius]|uniref:Uncharacterized protein n=1 Tax=Lithocarpus litseifolius TaxID=425828 RepID=A0AAW2DG29_9ROSI
MLVDRLPQLELDRWATISWALWNARNKYYFEHVQQHTRVILEGALGFLAEYQSALAWSSPCYKACGPVLYLGRLSFVLSRVLEFSPGVVPLIRLIK